MRQKRRQRYSLQYIHNEANNLLSRFIRVTIYHSESVKHLKSVFKKHSDGVVHLIYAPF